MRARRRLIVGTDRIQLVELVGNDDTVVLQIPYSNLAEVKYEATRSHRRVGIDLLDLNDPETYAPRTNFETRRRAIGRHFCITVGYEGGPTRDCERDYWCHCEMAKWIMPIAAAQLRGEEKAKQRLAVSRSLSFSLYGQTPPIGRSLMSQDEDQLRLLSIFHYVVGGITALFALFPAIYLAFGLVIVFAPQIFHDNKGQPPPEILGWILIGFATVAICFAWIFAALIITAGRFLARRKHYMFCMVMAAVECIFMPFGTVLGVFTIVVLMRETVKRLFAGAGAA